jgi:superfamily II DNA or RNA helicase
MSFGPGNLVRARGREWVVLPGSESDFLVLRPLGGSDDEIGGIHLSLEHVESAQFSLPNPAAVGDYRSSRLLRDAVRLSTRSSAGPFRSFGKIGVEPRPYQLVPLLMSLKQNPVRLLIADDVGVGKTIEAGLIAREFLDRGAIQRIAVLCPPHLAEQWQLELRNKFHIEAELVLASTATRLERDCRVGESLFERYPHVIVSMDFIKSDARRDDFARTCPEFVIVDEAHLAASSAEGRGTRHLRNALLRRLSEDPERHLVLVTATPHSGKEEAFRSLLSLLNPEFASLPNELGGPQNAAVRRRLAAHFIQRRRADLRHYLQTDTPFPRREEAEATYGLTSEYRDLFRKCLEYAREVVSEGAGGGRRERVRWWSALALLRSLASSPAAAASTLRNRARTADAETPEEADEIGRRTVLDIEPDDQTEAIDVVPGGDPGEEDEAGAKNRSRLLDLARVAEALEGKKDAKLTKAIEIVKQLLDDGHHPIVFCRYIQTADYLARELRAKIPNTQVVSVTGALPPTDRENRVMELAKATRRVLVCTDCLSEGVNLQDHFDSVVHYDLSWNPTRHEQRAGRVDRYGQPADTVRVITYYGTDNQIDGIVLNVLIRKHDRIRNSLGISVPVPSDTNTVLQAIFEGLLLRQNAATIQTRLPGFEEEFQAKRDQLFSEWEDAAEREKRSRTLYAQDAIKVEDVAREFEETTSAIGSSADVERFTADALRMHGAILNRAGGATVVDLRATPRALRDVLGGMEAFTGRFQLPVGDDELYLSRTHPIVEGLASYIMDAALDSLGGGTARRAGAIRTRAVETRTTLLIVRLRYDIVTKQKEGEQTQIAEECRALAFAGPPSTPTWLSDETTERLLQASPDANITPEQATAFVRRVVDEAASLRTHLDVEGRERGERLLAAHRRQRDGAQIRGVSYRVEPRLPADLLGIYVLLPVAGGEAN